MRQTVALMAVVGVGLAGCASKPAAAPQPPAVASTATAPTSVQPAAPAETCATPLPDRGDIIEWQREPGLPDSAIELGGTDPERCVWTFDTLKTSSPNGPGDCTQAAWLSDNVGYNADAKPAPRLKNVQVAIGDCG